MAHRLEARGARLSLCGARFSVLLPVFSRQAFSTPPRAFLLPLTRIAP